MVHRKFRHDHDPDTCEMHCRHCGANKKPEYLVFCTMMLAQFGKWPWLEWEGVEK